MRTENSSPNLSAPASRACLPLSNRELQALAGKRLEHLPSAIELPADHPDFERVRCEVIRKGPDGNWNSVADAYWTIERRAA